jgi:hypothetical protein
LQMEEKAKWRPSRAIYEHYHQTDRKRKHAVLNKFCGYAVYHGKLRYAF